MYVPERQGTALLVLKEHFQFRQIKFQVIICDFLDLTRAKTTDRTDS